MAIRGRNGSATEETDGTDTVELTDFERLGAGLARFLLLAVRRCLRARSFRSSVEVEAELSESSLEEMLSVRSSLFAFPLVASFWRFKELVDGTYTSLISGPI